MTTPKEAARCKARVNITDKEADAPFQTLAVLRCERRRGHGGRHTYRGHYEHELKDKKTSFRVTWEEEELKGERS
jgi:hypothetical protein